MTAKWGLYHQRHGFMSALTAMMFIDSFRVRNVNGVALFDTRTTARTVKQKLLTADVPVGDYKPVRAAVKVEVVK